mgnify:FL=1
MNKTEIKELIKICKENNLNPKNLIEFNKAIKIYKNEIL